MTRAAVPLPLATIALLGCMAATPSGPTALDRPVDTITITRTAAPTTPDTATPGAATPDPRPVMVCLATGQNVQVHVSAAGDTLVGPGRVPLVDIGPLLGFVGEYAASKGWFVHDHTITFEQRNFSKAGQPATRDCHAIRVVGDYQGVNLFADSDAAGSIRTLYLPVQPGLFQTYRTADGRVRR